MTFPRYTALLLLAASLAGCAPKDDTGIATGAEPKTESTSGAAGTTSGTETATPDVSAIPEELKHDAYAYSGLSVQKPEKYLFARVEGEKPEAGTQTTTFKGMKDGVATFSVSRDGSISNLGTEEMEVHKDGVYLVSSSLGKPEKPVMVMPANLKPGDTWSDKYELATAADDRKIQFTGTSKVEDGGKVKAAGKEFDTLVVVQTLDMNNAGTKGNVSSKTWYAKDIGVVRMRMELKDDKGKVVASTIELAEDPRG
ncbi:MAG: hypothetical protein KIT11_10345 [Fimbriimonadaceae bacterium]|nr:hypothetical protein [Fimbriimonadaceae bacterium]QYK55721.1 MAG: hypothetical protein KF733_12015 [Fimbriimonadaceae bacterium]